MSAETTFLYNPATGEELQQKTIHSVDDVKAAARAAARAQISWAARSVRERSAVIRRAVPYIVDHADTLAELVSACTGKPRVDALSTEVLPGAILCRYYSRKAAGFLKARRIGRSSLLFFNKRTTLFREPYGVVGIISPWNYPLGIPLHEVVTALLCGNAVLLKVATQAQPIGDAIAAMLDACGLPEGLLTVLHVPGRIAGDAFLDAGIGKLFFTGSTEVGRELAGKAGRRLVPVSLELGGNDGMIVLRDANIERAVAGAVWAGLSNSGQSCGAVERICVATEIYENFVEKLSSVVTKLSVGADSNFSTDIGALTTEEQRATVKQQIAEAVKEGGTVAAESPNGVMRGPDAGFYHPAMVLENVDADSALMRHETFGPVLVAQRITGEADAVAMVNDSYLGLTASIWTSDRGNARAIARQIDAGTVSINDHLMSHGMPEAPWGGYKQSGIGRCHGELGFHEMTQPKVVVDEMLPWMKKNMWWHPYSRRVYDGLNAGLQAVYGRGVLRRIANALKLASLFLSRAFGKS